MSGYGVGGLVSGYRVSECLLFSATFRKKVERLYRDSLADPIKIVVGDLGEAVRVRVWTLTLSVFLALSLFLVLELVLFVQSCEYMYQYPL